MFNGANSDMTVKTLAFVVDDDSRSAKSARTPLEQIISSRSAKVIDVAVPGKASRGSG